ncbi:diguanylate cyclase domain-containing protein [Alishewanella longhuensis]
MASSDKLLSIRDLVDRYLQHYARRDPALTAFFSSDFTGYALDDTAQVQDGREWSTRLLHDFPNIAGPLDVVVHNIAIQQISEQVMLAAVFFKLFLSEQSDVLQNAMLQHLLLFRLEQGEWKIVHSNLSYPCRQQPSAAIPLNYWQIQNSVLEKIVADRTRDLHEKEEFYRLLTEDTLDVLWRADSDLRITYISPSDERFRGFKAEEVIGHHVFELFNDEGVAIVKAAYQKRLAAEAAGEPYGAISFEAPHLCKDGSVVWGEVQSKALRDEQGKIIGFHGITRENTLRKQLHDEVKKHAFYDALTQLPNRRLLTELLQQAISNNKRSGSYGAVMFLDLDNFKPLNDQHGHLVGDLLLIEVGQRLKHCVRESDAVARFRGDEFVVMLPDLGADLAIATDHASSIAEKIRAALAQAYLLERTGKAGAVTRVEHHCSASIGVYVFGTDDTQAERILKYADQAMYQAKHAGRNTIRFYQHSD